MTLAVSVAFAKTIESLESLHSLSLLLRTSWVFISSSQVDMATQADLDIIYEWQKDFWKFSRDCFKMRHAEPIDTLKGKPITYTDSNGRKQTTLLFDSEGYPVYHDLKFYKRKHFKNQLPKQFKEHCKASSSVF